MLVDRVARGRILILSGMSGVLAAVTAAVSLLRPRVYDGALPANVQVGPLGFDLMSMLAALTLVGLDVALRRGAERFWLVWLGLQGYLLYAYSLYAFGLVFTPLYVGYLAIMGFSAYALAGFALSFEKSVLQVWTLVRLPRRTMGVSLILMAGTLAALWLLTTLGALGPVLPDAAAIVLVLDLAFMLPLLLIVGALLLRARPLGDLLAPGVFGMFAVIVIGVASGELLRPLFGESPSLTFATPYLIPGLVCLGFSLLAYRRVSAAISVPSI